ncbi:MAG TPA: TlpA disulfide reductase family protein [Chitinophagaceae bacterium]|nr:TlpA disulfide reductase family protein [Chitinophagaceae bacterium]
MKIIFSILILFFSVACNHHYYAKATNGNERNYILYGKVDGLDSGMLYLVHIDTTGKVLLPALDSVNFTNGFFLFRGKIPNPEPCKLMLKDLKQGWPWTAYFILDSGITTAQLFKDSMANSLISGTEVQERFTAFNKKILNVAITYQKTAIAYRKESKNTDSLDSQFYKNKYDLILNEVKENPKSLVSAYLVKRNLEEQWSATDLEEIYNSLENKNNYYSNYLLKLIIAKQQTQLNKPAPNFKIVDSKNRTLTNETFKGKYLLIDFWASWCPPCREENPYLMKAYKKFADKGFEIVSISLDENKKNWEDAVKQDSLSWIQVCDLNGSHSRISEDFGFLTIPTNFLIDKEGRIINKNLRDTSIENVLQEVFKAN